MQNRADVQRAARVLRDAVKASGSGLARVGIILGTGLSSLGGRLEGGELAWADIPGFPLPQTASHRGSFRWGELGGVLVLAQTGRCHLYEGRTPSEVCMGVRVMGELGVRTLILTNCAGALAPAWDAGTLMCMTDQINFTGVSPLTGQNDEAWGERFPDMSAVFDPGLRRLALESAARLGVRLERGVYVGVHGPELETPAETRLYRRLGADAIGMSSVLEVIAARHMGMRVLGLSCLSNKNLPDCQAPTSIAEIIAAAESAGADLSRLIEDVVAHLPAPSGG